MSLNVPFLGHIDSEGLLITKGTRETPNFQYATNGARDDSVIFHTEEDGNFYQYHKWNVQKNHIRVRCMYNKNIRANCRAVLKLAAKKDGLINKRKINGAVRFYLASSKLDENTSEEWEAVENSGIHEHSEYCKKQIPVAEQPKLDDYVRDQMSGKEIQNFNKKFCRFGPYQPLARHLRFKHTRAAMKHKELQFNHTVKELNIPSLGSRFLPKMVNISNEKKSGWYHQAKNSDKNDGVDPEFLEILNNIPGFFRPITEKWIHLDKQTNNFVPIYLESELCQLQMSDLFADGTFSICRNINFQQIYIFSKNISNSTNTRTFSYPVLMFLMKKRSTKNYEEILNFMKNIFFEKCAIPLKIKSVHSDAEYAFLSAVQTCFPECHIFLCSVHILRAVQKQLKSKVSGNFFEDETLTYIWRVISGSIFLNLCDDQILKEIVDFLYGSVFMIPEQYKTGYLNFVNYLVKFYFSESSPFNPGNFNYYNSIISEGYMTSSTNCLESLNRRLKEKSGQGFLSFNKACSVIKEFKVHYIQAHEENIVNDRLNKRKKTTIDRENHLSKILNTFYDLDYDTQKESTVTTAFEIGNISSLIRASNSVFNSTINAVVTSEAELESIVLSFDEWIV